MLAFTNIKKKKINVGMINQYIGYKKVDAPSPCYTPKNKPTVTWP